MSVSAEVPASDTTVLDSPHVHTLDAECFHAGVDTLRLIVKRVSPQLSQALRVKTRRTLQEAGRIHSTVASPTFVQFCKNLLHIAHELLQVVLPFPTLKEQLNDTMTFMCKALGLGPAEGAWNYSATA